MSDLRSIFPTRIVRGALLRPDGCAVGLVVGGAPSWDLLSLAARAQASSDYHRVLLALDAPIDVYLVDQPPDAAGEITTLIERQARADHPQLAGVLSEMADYLAELGLQSGSRAKQVIWAVTAGHDTSVSASGLELMSLIGRARSSKASDSTRAGKTALA